ncbi:MAG: hypothetical protein A2Y82_00905 [Candidatus Buchananbacteria bacterium RBG_13_36_9]|uniref:Uncharacterized protein n=1 Tax=Candidatus Buchananbacteria bacterium RBG_13_36_9 TaxID=1797530 RepID=A0A1G1XPB8_9BACT|nr:MAG: hypothetical protein A2Y82_00905 [Candidatus Buchananbacteria bacterium RBG_13_36_9]
MRNIFVSASLLVTLVILAGCPPPSTYNGAPVARNNPIYPVSTAVVQTPCQRIFISGVGTNTGLANALGYHGVYDGQCVTPEQLEAIRSILADNPTYMVEITPDYIYIGPGINIATVIFENRTYAWGSATLINPANGAVECDLKIRPGGGIVQNVPVGVYNLHIEHWDNSRKLVYDKTIQISRRLPTMQEYSAYAKARGDRVISILPQ